MNINQVINKHKRNTDKAFSEKEQAKELLNKTLIYIKDRKLIDEINHYLVGGY